jgi:hypothetical protein
MRTYHPRMRIPAALAFALLWTTAVHAQERPLPFDSGWTLEGDRTSVTTVDGRQALQVETGYAHRRDVTMMDGTIDLDVQVTRRRSFVYIYFRALAGGAREEFYLRPHKSGLPDATQYAPVWQGRSAWQLHHGPGGTAAVAFEPGEWIHVRVVVQDRHAALFVKDMNTPVLLVPRLAREPKAGHIALGGFLPANVPGEGPIARFSNVVVKPDVSFDFARAMRTPNASSSPSSTSSPAFTVIRSWSVSQAFVPKDGVSPTIPGSSVTGPFTPLETDPDGLLALERHVKVPEGTRLAAAVARVNVQAEQAGTYTFELGFSDIATVFVNGVPVFRGDASYSFDRPRREGLIGYDQATLFLPLRAGSNDVAVVVSDSFGGWGIMGRLRSAPGLTLEERR